MTKFNPENKEILTYGDCLKPAMEITDKEDSIQYKTDYIAFTQKELDTNPSQDGNTAEDIVNSNLGYFAGYYDSETRKRVERLFMCSHPVFGSIEKNGSPSSEDAFVHGISALSFPKP